MRTKAILMRTTKAELQNRLNESTEEIRLLKAIVSKGDAIHGAVQNAVRKATDAMDATISKQRQLHAQAILVLQEASRGHASAVKSLHDRAVSLSTDVATLQADVATLQAYVATCEKLDAHRQSGQRQAALPDKRGKRRRA